MVGRLLQLNGVAILGVILFHTAGWGFVAMFAWSHRYLPAGVDPMVQMGSFSYYVLRGIEQFAVFSIPAFLFVSGYFIAFATPRRQATVSWSIVWARIRGLLIPYLIWSLVLIVFLGFQGRRLSPAGYATALLTGRVNPAYYYVPLLCQFYLLSPLLVFLARRWWQWLLLAALAIQLSIQLLYYPALLQVSAGVLQPYVDVVPKWIFPVRIFWFVAGLVAGFHLAALKQFAARWKWWWLAGLLLLFAVGMVEWEVMQAYAGQGWSAHRETFLDTAYGGLVILAFLAFSDFNVPFAGFVSELGAKSFGIYLLHSPVMEVTARLIYRFMPGLLAHQEILQPVLVVASLGGPLLLMALVNRSPFRRYYRWLFG